MLSSRPAELGKGLLTVGPLFVGLVVLATTLVLLTSTIGVHATWPAWVMLSASCVVLVATSALAARYWNRSRWRAYGVLAVAFVFVGGLMAIALVGYLLFSGVAGSTS